MQQQTPSLTKALRNQIAAATLLLALTACGGSTPTVTLAQAQAEAKVIDTALHTAVQTYLASASVSSADQANITLALSSLDVAVNNFTSLTSNPSDLTLANAVINTANAVVQAIPNIPQSAKAATEAGILVLQAVLPLIPQLQPAPAPSVPPAPAAH